VRWRRSDPTVLVSTDGWPTQPTPVRRPEQPGRVTRACALGLAVALQRLRTDANGERDDCGLLRPPGWPCRTCAGGRVAVRVG